MTTPIRALQNMHGTLVCPKCEQHEMSIEHLGWDQHTQAVCAICGTNWRIDHPSTPPGVQLMYNYVLREEPQKLTMCKALLQHNYHGFYVIVTECAQGEDHRKYLENLYANENLPLEHILGVSLVAGTQMKLNSFSLVSHRTHEEIREYFNWTWKEFAENGPSEEQLREIFSLEESA